MSTHTAKKVDAVRMQGVVKKGRLTVKEKVDLPDGTVEVTLFVKSASVSNEYEDLSKHPAFGMWRGRTDIQGAVSYAKKLRKKIDQELTGGRQAR
jgi:phage major head subunit gpT-like protein